MINPRVLIIYYSLSKQTLELLNRLSTGLKEQEVQVTVEKLEPVFPLSFPFAGVFATVKMMLATLFRRRFPIKELSSACWQDFKLIIIAGPTWSYNPSGPVLSLVDRDGEKLFCGKQVLALISCRGYWRLHWFGLRRLLKNCGAKIENLIVFSHPCKEPWRTLGVFLKIAGKNPEHSKIIGRYYKNFGHSREQYDEAWRFGLEIGEALKRRTPLSELNFQTPISLP